MFGKIPAYAGMTAFLTFRLLLGFCKGFRAAYVYRI